MLERIALRWILIWATVALGGTALVVITPFLLKWLAPSGLNWNELSDISQTYGGLSILVSAAALIGVVASLSYQAKQVRIEHQEAHRSAHRELILRALSDQEFLTCWGPLSAPVPRERYKKLLFTNLIVGFWSTNFRLGRTSEAVMLNDLKQHFRGEIARAHWAEARERWRASFEPRAADRLGRKFVDLMDQAYGEATAAGPAVSESDYFTDSGG
ncbi:DUF6082 family protein [Streptomyces sp. NPDC059575]|uniref:DUF6082 family protein n=1 Tax=Streptomyces sp. NPDC059575 TaxID=3346872 RepID=UPI0036921C8B